MDCTRQFWGVSWTWRHLCMETMDQHFVVAYGMVEFLWVLHDQRPESLHCCAVWNVDSFPQFHGKMGNDVFDL